MLSLFGISIHYFYTLFISFKWYLTLRLIEADIKEDRKSGQLFVIMLAWKWQQ